MVCEMGEDYVEEEDMEEVLPSMWPEDLGKEVGKKFTIEKPGLDQDMLEEVPGIEDSSVDFKRLLELTNYSEKGSNELGHLVKHWEYKQANAVRLLNEEIDNLSKQRKKVELKKLEILEEHRFEEQNVGDKRSISILEEGLDIWDAAPLRKHDIIVQEKGVDMDAEYNTITIYDTIKYWKERALKLDKMLEASVQREQVLVEKLQENMKSLEKLSSPVEELSQVLKRADRFLHFVLQNAPVVIGHQDKDLRYRFIYNHFPSLGDEDIIGKTDVEIFTGAGVKESQDFKKEVMERGRPAKREITFETPLFGSKTFLIHVEPVFSKAGDTIGVNYMGMDITDQVIKREKMAKLREEIAVQKAKETELNKTIHITEETMRAKQMLATMSHEIRSPLTGVVSMAEILSNSRLDREQRQLLDVMMSSGDLVLQLINDILDLSKVESGVMKLEATKFRPREVLKHVLQTAAASLQKELTLEGHVAEDVPVAVIGDVLRIRQILTNLVSNAVKFTHKGKVGIKLSVVLDPQYGNGAEGNQTTDHTSVSTNRIKEEASHSQRIGEAVNGTGAPEDGNRNVDPVDSDKETHAHPDETTVWIQCDVFDTGIGIPENALPNLFRKYMQASADHARKYGGTGLGLAICKQLVELMGGRLTVTSQVHHGSTFTFLLPYKVSPGREQSDEHSDMDDEEIVSDANSDDMAGFFHFEPRALGSLFSSGGTTRNLSPNNVENKLKNISQDLYAFPSNNCVSREMVSAEDASSVTDISEAFSKSGSPSRQHLEPDNRKSAYRGKPCQNGTNGQLDTLTADSHRCKKTCLEAGSTTKRNNVQGTCQKQDQETFDRSSQSRTSSSSEPDNAGCKPKILLVEDNKINIMVATSMMKQIGHTLDVVNNGVEAVRAVQRHRYDLVLMDVHMPVMDGLQATRLIRSFEETGSWDAAVEAGIELSTSGSGSGSGSGSTSLQNGLNSTSSRRRLPIVAMTANTVSESSDVCLANGMDSFVSKPVTTQKLKECLRQYIPC